MRKHRRILSLALCLALLPVSARAADAGVTELVPCKYDYIGDFSDGLAAVSAGDPVYEDKWGFIDKTGREVIPCVHSGSGSRPAGPFSEGLAAMWGDTGEKNEYGSSIYGWGFIDKTGQTAIHYKYGRVRDFSEGLAAVSVGRRPSSSNGKWGFIDKVGREVVPARYDDTGDFSEGLAPVYVGAHPNGKWGFIDKTGQEIVPCLYEGYDPPRFVDGLAAVRLDGKWGFIDKTGQEIIPCKYDEAEDFSEGLALVYLDGKCGFIDAAGKEVLPCAYEGVCSFSDGLAAVKQNGKRGFIDKTGREVIPFRYDDAWDFSEGFAAVEQNGKWGFIDKTGKTVIPCQYDLTWGFSEGLAAVGVATGEKDEAGNDLYKWGFVDSTGREVVPCVYDEAEPFDQGLAVVGIATGEMDENGIPVCKWGLLAAPQVGTLGDRGELTWAVAGDKTTVSITAGADALGHQDMVLAACWDAAGRFVGTTVLQADRLEGRLPEGFSYGKLLWLSADRAPRCQYAQMGAID